MHVSEVAGFAYEAFRPIRPQQIIDIHQVAAIRREPGSEIASQYAGYTAGRFAEAWGREDGILPVVIPCHNEAEDLPGTLLSVARSGNMVPLVIDNNSNDDTAQIAEDMGAVVIEQREGKKMAATQAGFRLARHMLEAETILFTDGDTLILPGWGEEMARLAAQADVGEGSAVFGPSISMFGRSRTADLACTALSLMHKVRNTRRGVPTVASGHNYALHPDAGGKMESVLMDLPSDAFVWPGQLPDDAMIGEAVREIGAAVVGPHELRLGVVTRNDRIGSLWDLVRLKRGMTYNQLVQDSYLAEYSAHAPSFVQTSAVVE